MSMRKTITVNSKGKSAPINIAIDTIICSKLRCFEITTEEHFMSNVFLTIPIAFMKEHRYVLQRNLVRLTLFNACMIIPFCLVLTYLFYFY